MQFNTEIGPKDINIADLVVAGWTGRNADAVQHHIDELAAIGVAPPSKVPLFYRVSNTLLTQDRSIDVLGVASSGEAEPLVLQHNGTFWIGLGSDHTDRDLETTSVAASKQICAKPCASTLWAFDDVAERLETLTIKSWIYENDKWTLYQDGHLGQILSLTDLIQMGGMAENTAMLCGTFPAIGGVRAAEKFRASLVDPQTDREILLEYEARVLPVIS